jgi:4'-phosphopantetheinyl transferase
MHDVDIYSSDLDAPSGGAETTLAPEERTRASRFRFERDRRRFINCRAALRRILAPYLDLDPAQIEFTYNEYGKPYVDGLHFNVSHADSLAMFAVSRSREVGIDVERIDPAFANEQIPERFFSPHEVRTLRALPESAQVQAFFNCWTRKEAYVKARGLGMSLSLASFDVSLTPGEPAAFLGGAGDWSLEAIEAAPGYAAAVVAKGIAAITLQPRPSGWGLSIRESRRPSVVPPL